ncbi:2-oxoacid:acceptor oxidoreductase family protein [Caldisalinibacter kiritimatiensis]|uniref:2-oxoglutarate oxidoreductase, gamma subunit n=1 Tax=Caldisalinibacter kiritimatiensis TaxID=1304284 RepID=R1AWS8_9FIRM|nr:2-oxoacid:acceptor oxidoreductase family protein [Caldisalinibacter kiritimatiensis]EOD01097.1 2-oxoglutarate oxidoreductase, gamma subunit [Caldisalinibacter kiritimatiensis]
MSGQYEIRLSGSGGQGLILAGIILAEAALLDGKNTVQSQSYGPEARGGASKSEVIISDNNINYPKVRKCDLLLSLTQEACNKYCNSTKKNGILIVDEKVIPPDLDNVQIHKTSILRTAAEKIKAPIVSNIVALGVLCETTNIVSKESLLKAILNRVPRGTEELNKKAFEAGVDLAKL